MAFRNERIPLEEVERLQQLLTDQTAELWKWTVDPERPAFLVMTKKWGGPYEGTSEEQHLALVLDQEVVRFVAEASNPAAAPVNGVLSWQVRSIRCSESLASRGDEVRAVIEEALQARGWLFDEAPIENRSYTVKAEHVVR